MIDNDILTNIISGYHPVNGWLDELCNADHDHDHPLRRAFYLIGLPLPSERLAAMERLRPLADTHGDSE